MPIQNAFVSDRAVLLTLGYGVKSFVRLIAYNVMEVVHRQSSGFRAVEVEDGLSPRVEGEATHLATFFSRSSAIGIIFGTTFHELFDRVSLQFVFGLSQESSSQQVGLSSHEADDRVGVHVEYTGEEGVQTFAIQFDASVRHGEGRHKDVGVGTQLIYVLLQGMVHVEHLLARGKNGVDVSFSVQEEAKEGFRVFTDDHLGLFSALTKFTPEAVGHQFGKRASTLVAFDLGRIEDHTFEATKLFHVLNLKAGIAFDFGQGPAVGFLLNFDPCIDVFAKKSGGGVRKGPHLLDVKDHVVVF